MPHYITREGLQKLQEELEHLKNVKRKEVAERIRYAISFGDLSENFDYHNAKEEQEMTERRIAEVEDILRDSSVISKKEGNDVVQIGSHVVVEVEGEQLSFTITGPQEADPLQGKISAESPLGQQLLGKKQGEIALTETPQGRVRYKIVALS